MTKAKTHIYFVPGLAAGKEIFENIVFQEDNYSIHILEWMIPYKNETLQDYALRMTQKIEHPNPVLIGVSFGGVVAQEMSLFLDLKKLIIISSVKSKFEFPKRMLIATKAKVYKLMPATILPSEAILSKLAIGPKSKKKLSLYKKYLSVRDKEYLNWAIQEMLCWERKKEVDNVIHIHGDNDSVFPIKNIENCIVVPDGSHIMIINKYRWLNENLPKIIEDNN